MSSRRCLFLLLLLLLLLLGVRTGGGGGVEGGEVGVLRDARRGRREMGEARQTP